MDQLFLISLWCFQFWFLCPPSLGWNTRTHTHIERQCIGDWVTLRFEAQLYVDQWVVQNSCWVNCKNSTPTCLNGRCHMGLSVKGVSKAILKKNREQAYPCYVVWYTLWGSIEGTWTLKNVALIRPVGKTQSLTFDCQASVRGNIMAWISVVYLLVLLER